KPQRRLQMLRRGVPTGSAGSPRSTRSACRAPDARFGQSDLLGFVDLAPRRGSTFCPTDRGFRTSSRSLAGTLPLPIGEAVGIGKRLRCGPSERFGTPLGARALEHFDVT
ncbi:MAG TPA: hypothetical protein DCQ98_14030, partial [Planctomycetaceae bacterium]|nr:hypothetical protein [Planctomycetaceae bacterium]